MQHFVTLITIATTGLSNFCALIRPTLLGSSQYKQELCENIRQMYKNDYGSIVWQKLTNFSS